MRIGHTYTACLAAIICALTGWVGSASAQSAFTPKLELRSVGVSVSSYSPSFDYFDQTFWDFDGAAAWGIETELSIMPALGVKAGLGYFRTSSSVDRAEFEGEETLTYTLTPFTIAPVARYSHPHFTVSFSPGIDFYRVKSSYESVAESESTSGNVTGFNLRGGLEREFGVIGIELFGKYVNASFEQQMQFEPGEELTTEEVSLDGLQAGITVKYLF